MSLTIAPRSETGRGAMNRLRAAGRIPCVVYAGGESKSFSVGAGEFGRFWRASLGSTPIIELSDGASNEPTLSIIQDVQRDPLTERFIHIDFHEVHAGEVFTAEVAVHTKGTPIGVKESGGTLEHTLYTVEVRCLPRDLPEYIEVDVATMGNGDSIHISDLPKLDGVEYTGEPETVVVHVAGKAEGATSAAEIAAEEAAEVEKAEAKAEADD